jgi:class 3 adenylate cyclase
VHTGECERVGDALRGIAVHIGSRIAGLANAGEILVSRTVRELAAGSEIAVEDAGRHLLKGVRGEWSLSRVVGSVSTPRSRVIPDAASGSPLGPT